MPAPLQPHREAEPRTSPQEYNPFEDIEFLPGLGMAVVYVVVAYAFVSLLLLPVHTV